MFSLRFPRGNQKQAGDRCTDVQRRVQWLELIRFPSCLPAFELCDPDPWISSPMAVNLGWWRGWLLESLLWAPGAVSGVHMHAHALRNMYTHTEIETRQGSGYLSCKWQLPNFENPPTTSGKEPELILAIWEQIPLFDRDLCIFPLAFLSSFVYIMKVWFVFILARWKFHSPQSSFLAQNSPPKQCLAEIFSLSCLIIKLDWK